MCRYVESCLLTELACSNDSSARSNCLSWRKHSPRWCQTSQSSVSTCFRQPESDAEATVSHLWQIDHLQIIYRAFPLAWWSINRYFREDRWSVRSVWPSSCCRVGVMSSAWSSTYFLGWICTMRNLARRRVRNNFVDDLGNDLSEVSNISSGATRGRRL